MRVGQSWPSVATIPAGFKLTLSSVLQGTVKGGKKTRQTEKAVGRQHRGMDRPGVRQVPEGQWRKGKNGGH